MKRQNRVTILNILSTFLLRSISFITMPLFTSLLGDSGYGMTQAYETWVSVLAIVFTMQTVTTLVNANIEYPPEELPKYQSSVLSMSLLLYLCCSVVVLIFLEPVAQLLKLSKPLVVIMLAHSFAVFSMNFLNTKFVYEFKAGRNLILSVSSTLLVIALSLIFVFRLPQETRYLGRISGIALGYVLMGYPACAWILMKGKTFYNKTYWKFGIVLAIPAAFHALSDLIMGHCDTVMLQQMLGAASLGRYSAAANFSMIMLTIFHALNNSWCPFFFEDMKNGDRDKVLEKARNFLEIFTVLSVGFILLDTEVLHRFVNETFWEATKVLPLLVGGLYLNFLCTFPVNVEYFYKKTKVVASVTVACSVLNIVLNYVLIRSMGMMGAALATMLSRGVQLALHYGYCRRLLKEGDYPFQIGMWWKYLAAYCAVSVLVLLTPDQWLLRWCFGGAIGVWELLRIRRRRVLI